MTDEHATDIEASLAKLEKDYEQLKTVLDVLYQALESKGLKPSYHLQQAMDSLERHLKGTRKSSDLTLKRLAQFGELVRTSALITSSLELDDVVREVLDTVIHLTGAERTYLMLYDDKGELYTYAARNWDQKSLAAAEIEFSRSIIDAALHDGLPILTTNAQTDERFGAKESIMIQKLRSILCIPLMLSGQMLGVLYSDNRYQQDLFEQDIIPILSAFGAQAAIAIKNAQLFGDVKEDLEEAQRVIMELQIVLDKARVEQQVSDITDTDYFRNLADMAGDLRKQYEQTRKKKKKQ